MSTKKEGKQVKRKVYSEDESEPEKSAPKVAKRRQSAASKAATSEATTESSNVPAAVVAPKKAPGSGHKGSEPHIRDLIVPKPLVDGHKFIKVISWNVCGMKSLASKNLNVLTNLVATHKPDVLCLQETKLQVSQVDEFRDILPGYDSYWSCSVDKKGYSGTAVFLNKATINTKSAVAAAVATGTDAVITGATSASPVKKKQSKLTSFMKKVDAEPVLAVAVTQGEGQQPPTTTASTSTSTNVIGAETPAEPLLNLQKVSFDFEDEARMFHGEGRTITVELDKMIIVACYVPNSGEGLVRLDYRVKKWDTHMREYLDKLRLRKPVVYAGDLNVGHLDLDIHNPTAKHIVKQAGLTPQERESHSTLLCGEFRDAFRFYYPDARGQFTYWSMRTFARPVNKGIRLDYFICSNDMFPLGTGGTANSAASGSSSNSGNKVDSAPVAATVIETACTTAVDASTGNATTVEAVRATEVSVEGIPTPGVFDSYSLPEDTKGCSDHAPVVLVVKV